MVWPQDRPLRITEVGFGRGFNLGVAARMWLSSRKKATANLSRTLQAYAFEPHPEALEPWPDCPGDWASWMPWWGEAWPNLQQQWEWPGLGRLKLCHQGAEVGPWPEEAQDLIILDLFSPSAHPESWQDATFAAIAQHSRPGTLLTTYSCARLVREKLRAHGFETQRIRRRGWRDTLLAVFQGPSRRAGQAPPPR